MSPLLNIDLIILFFFLGVLSSWAKSDLSIPDSVSRFLSIFLLLSLGLKGGQEVRGADGLDGFAYVLGLGLFSCLAIPLYVFPLLKRKLGSANAAAMAACYGSVSAVTLVSAQGFLENAGVGFSGYMVAVMALMEIPAIVIALHLFRREMPMEGSAPNASVWAAKSVVLLLGGFLIGLFMSEDSFRSIAPVVKDSFKGVLAFFLLDLGIAAQRQIKLLWRQRRAAVLIGLGLPLVHGSLALLLASLFVGSAGDQVLLAVLVGSASYIAAPAAIKSAIPEANPSLYVALPLALTFPMNVLIGIPFYLELSRWLA